MIHDYYDHEISYGLGVMYSGSKKYSHTSEISIRVNVNLVLIKK
jgi:hypothetical protein